MIGTLINIDYSIYFDSAFHMGSGIAAGITDRQVVKNSDGYMIIPGSMLKGVFRNQVQRLCNLWGISSCNSQYSSRECFGAHPCLVCSLFGSRFAGEKLFFSNGLLPRELREKLSWEKTGRPFGQTQNRTQIKISRRRGVAQEKYIFKSEYGNSGLYFNGSVYGKLYGIASAEHQAIPELAVLITGMLLTEQFGAGKSYGFGSVKINVKHIMVDHNTYSVEEIINGLDHAVHFLRGRSQKA